MKVFFGTRLNQETSMKADPDPGLCAVARIHVDMAHPALVSDAIPTKLGSMKSSTGLAQIG